MKLIIDIPEQGFSACKLWVKNRVATWQDEIIANGTPYNPSGDLISREALKEAVKNRFDNSEYFPFHFLALIDNAPPISPYKALHDELHKGEEE